MGLRVAIHATHPGLTLQETGLLTTVREGAAMAGLTEARRSALWPPVHTRHDSRLQIVLCKEL